MQSTTQGTEPVDTPDIGEGAWSFPAPAWAPSTHLTGQERNSAPFIEKHTFKKSVNLMGL